MRIKEHKNKNRYALTDQNVWVRDFTRPNVPYQDVNKLTLKSDYKLLLDNEINNRLLKSQRIDTIPLNYKKILIVSDGLDFKEKQKSLLDLPKDVIILAVNGALNEWEIQDHRKINFYVVNNPYPQCQGFFPHKTKYFPKCISSTRTNPEFLKNYNKKNPVLQYVPTREADFAGIRQDADYQIDDYRNPIAAAVSLAYHMKVEKLLTLCCDDSRHKEKPGMIETNGVFTYPQHLISHGILQTMFHWLTNQEDHKVEVRDHSQGPNYYNAPYIPLEEIGSFFRDDDG